MIGKREQRDGAEAARWAATFPATSGLYGPSYLGLNQLYTATAPFDEATSIAGPVAATLFQRADRTESVVVLTLQDVAPGGKAKPLRLSITTNLAPALLVPAVEAPNLLGSTVRLQRTRAAASRLNVPLIASKKLRTSPITWGGCQGGC